MCVLQVGDLELINQLKENQSLLVIHFFNFFL